MFCCRCGDGWMKTDHRCRSLYRFAAAGPLTRSFLHHSGIHAGTTIVIGTTRTRKHCLHQRRVLTAVVEIQPWNSDPALASPNRNPDVTGLHHSYNSQHQTFTSSALYEKGAGTKMCYDTFLGNPWLDHRCSARHQHEVGWTGRHCASNVIPGIISSTAACDDV
jgi:hypothetical protein